MGTLYIDANNKDNLEDFNTIIYGHHMKDPMHSMFGSLNEYSAGSEPLYPLERATLSAW